MTPRLNRRMGSDPAAELVGSAVLDTGRTLLRLPGRVVTRGLLEKDELGAALHASLVREGVAAQHVALGASVEMSNWNRPTSEVDLVVYKPNGHVEFAAELKVWDIGHQLFDAAKACCLLAARVPATFLICVARQSSDFGRMPGGELFPSAAGVVLEHDFVDLIQRHRAEWQRHVGRGAPEPTGVPTRISTNSVSVDIEIEAYPGHALRAVSVAVIDWTLIPLADGWPEGVTPPP